MINFKNDIVLINCQNHSIQESGGVGTYIYNLAYHIDANSHDFKIIFENKAESNFLNKNKGFRHKIVSFIRLFSPPLFIITAKKIIYRNKLKENNFLKIENNQNDKILIHEITNYTIGVKTPRFVSLKKNKLISTFHDLQDLYYPDFFDDAEIFKRRLSYEYLKNKSCHFIANSQFTKNSMIEKLNIPENKITVTYLGVNVTPPVEDVNFQKTIKSFGNYFLYPAKYWKHKNHILLFKSISKMKTEFRSKKYKLILTGGFSQQNIFDIKKILKNLDISDLVVISGFVQSNQLKLLMTNAQYLLFPSLFEGFGIPVIEAMSLSCPVISSTAGPLSEICGDSAILFNPESSDELENILSRALTESIDRSALIKKGLENSKRFTWQKCYEETIKIYKNILSDNNI